MSGTASELKFSGLVNTGPLRRPSLNESCSTDFSLPITPEINLENESINVNAANSPPLKIKSPIGYGAFAQQHFVLPNRQGARDDARVLVMNGMAFKAH